MPKSLPFLGNLCKDVKIYHFSSEIIVGQFLLTFGDFFWSHCCRALMKRAIPRLCLVCQKDFVTQLNIIFIATPQVSLTALNHDHFAKIPLMVLDFFGHNCQS